VMRSHFEDLEGLETDENDVKGWNNASTNMLHGKTKSQWKFSGLLSRFDTFCAQETGQMNWKAGI
jgi:hypothetical protein